MTLFFELSMPRLRRCLRGAAGLVLAGAGLCVHAQMDESRARAIALDLQAGVSEAASLIGDLQDDINAGHLGNDKASPDALLAALSSRYAAASGKPFDDKGSGPEAESRRALLGALRDTLDRYHASMVKGGQDAFVPAFFRAELLKRFNVQMKGKVQAYATNRDKDLINADWSVDQVMKGSPLVGEVKSLMAGGSLAPVVKRSGDRLLGYWPMKLAPACVACHAKNGLQQREGGFGGAFVAEVLLK